MDQKQYRAWLAEYDFIGVANRRKHEREQREAEASAQNEKSMETKVCKTCGRTLPVSAFSACVLTADKLQPNCKECMKRKQKDGWKKKAQELVEEVATEVAPANLERLKADYDERAEAPQADVESCNIGEIPRLDTISRTAPPRLYCQSL